MTDDSNKPPLTPAQEAARNAAAGALTLLARAASRAVESLFDDGIKILAGKRRAVREWRRENVGDEPGDLDKRAEEELQ